MIVPMHKVLLLALKSERDSALAAVRKLGVLEVVSETLADSGDRAALAANLARLDRAVAILDARIPRPATGDSPRGRELAEAVLRAVGEAEQLDRETEALRKERAGLEPWGEYDPARLTELAAAGIHVYLCEASEEQHDELEAALTGAAVVDLGESQGFFRFAVVSDHALEEAETLPVVVPGTRSLHEVELAEHKLEVARLRNDDELDYLASHLGELRRYRGEAGSELELLAARDGMADCGEIVVLKGFVPVPEADALRRAASAAGWGLVLGKPAPGETVPVLLNPPRWVRPVLPLFEFLGISPGYEEFDMSPGMLIFFAIFFSMIINDAGYGLLLLGGAIAAAVLLRKNRRAALPCRLALLLSLCSVAWGVASGSYFGVEKSPLAFFAGGAQQTAHLELVCFVLALVHLSLGHCWRLVNAGSVREVIGQLGWIPILVLDFMVVCSLLVFPGMSLPVWSLWLGGAGLAMVLAGAVDWTDVGAICNFPFDLIGSFTDTLSYVRLFAVGMSGTYMAMSFNDMGMTLWHSSPWLIPVAVLVILFGHTLNVALAFMSVLVHGVRLNTLEFSNHAGIRWGGQAYRPLREFHS